MSSPPCQPFTRNNDTDKRDSVDARSSAFLHIIQILRTIDEEVLPKYIGLENVVGFETSVCCGDFIAVLVDRGFEIHQFILTPTQMGIPNSRPRYYCVAVRRNNNSVGVVHELKLSLPGCSIDDPTLCTGLQNYLDSPEKLNENVNSNNTGESISWLAAVTVPQDVIDKSASWCFDIVSEMDNHTSCFTKSYSRFIRGSGSVIRMEDTRHDHQNKRPKFTEIAQNTSHENDNNETKKEQCKEWSQGIRLRYFTPSELLKLFGFNSLVVSDSHNSFSFPMDKVTIKKTYELIGNSLNVLVVTAVLKHVFNLYENK